MFSNLVRNFKRIAGSRFYTTSLMFHNKSNGGQQLSQKNVDYLLVLDFEATCDRGRIIEPQEIIEFPVLKVNVRNLQVESEFHRFVRPVFHPELTTFCTNLTGIIQDMVDNEQTIQEVLRSFDRWLQDEGLQNRSFVFVTCGDWDLGQMLPAQCRSANLLLAPYFRTWMNLKKVFAECTDKYPRTLPDMLEHFNLKLQGRLHSGIDDCYNMVRVLQAMEGRYACQWKVTGHLK